MQSQNLQSFTDAVHAKGETGELWQLMVDFMAERGVRQVSFHTVARGGGMADPIVRAHGFPEDWVRHYIESDLVNVDPIVALAARRSKPFFWRDVGKLTRLSDAEKAFLRELETAQLGEGLAMQVYGPGGRTGYVGLGFGRSRPDLTEPQIFEFKSAAQIGYLKYCELTEHAHALARDLSPREEEILGWIARGKSNGVIADIVGVSRHTVDTNIRRIFEKLEATDRTTAALRGVGAGIILLDRDPVPQVRDKT
ncbi:MAG: LuxR family transcriptional regulator [Pseudomonadota bacterium]